MVSISIRQLSKRFGSTQVLQNIDLDIAPGDLFFLLGPSGCGKTTLLRHVAGFYRPDSGSIFFDDREVTRVPVHKRGTGMMFQSYALWPHMTVAENVAFGLQERQRPHQEIEQRVALALEQVQLVGLGARRIQQLSGGQQQRVALARALVIRPNCLLLDEPLSNLDAKLRIEMREEIRRICKEFGLTGIYVTHDRDEALSMADQMAIMDQGQIIQVGTPEDVYRNPVTAMVAGFIGETNLIQGTILSPTQDHDGWEIETAVGVLHGRQGRSSRELNPGDTVTLSIRPESLTFSNEVALPNQLLGIVRSTIYLGATVQYDFELTDGTRVQILELNPKQVRHEGESGLSASCALEDCVILDHSTP